MDVKQAAELLAVKPSTLYQWAYQRRIPVVKLFDRALRFRLSTIERLVHDSERPAIRPLHSTRAGVEADGGGTPRGGG